MWAMSEMIELLRMAVEPSECDVMGHLNVRHYVGRAYDGLCALAMRMGALDGDGGRSRGQRFSVREQHVRFHRELRPGAAYRMVGGVLSVTDTDLSAYAELYRVHGREGETLAATAITRATLVERGTGKPIALDGVARSKLASHLVSLPEHGAPRGVASYPPRPTPTRADAVAAGMVGAYLGPVDPAECDAGGGMLPIGYMGRMSNGIPHFLAKRGLDRQVGMGGAALEYRFVYRGDAHLGEQIEIFSGLRSVERKTRHFCHWIFNAHTGACLATSHGVAVMFDLEARRAVALDETQRRELELLANPALGA